MQNSKKIALIVGVIGLLVCIPCFFLTDEDMNSVILSIAVWYTVLVLLAVTLYFIWSYFHDFKIHPEFRQEAKTIGIYFFSAVIISFILALVTGGADPIASGNGTLITSKSELLSITTIIYTAIILLLAAVVWSLMPLFKKKSNS